MNFIDFTLWEIMNKHSTDEVQMLYSPSTAGTDSIPTVQIQRTV